MTKEEAKIFIHFPRERKHKPNEIRFSRNHVVSLMKVYIEEERRKAFEAGAMMDGKFPLYPDFEDYLNSLK